MNAYTGFDVPRAWPHPPREERRPVQLKGWFVRSTDDSIWDFEITDLSYAGCRIATGAPLAKGEPVRLSVQKRGLINATVRWRRGGHVGLAFDEAQPAPKHWPRKSERLIVDCPVLVRRAGRRHQLIEASDFSRHGCCLSFADVPAVGERLWIRLAHLENLQAEVRWTKGFRCGVAFQTPIHAAVFDLLQHRDLRPTNLAAGSSRLRH